jgi:drug/metabolite transporter (DMT)-like permease
VPSLTALLLVLTSALLHALWNACIKNEPEAEPATTAILVVATGAAWAAWPLAPAPSFAGRVGLLWAVGAGLCEGGYFVTLGRALQRAPLGVAYTVARGGAILAVWPLSALLLAEPVTLPGVTGAAVLAIGLALVGLERLPATGPAGLAWSGLCALFIAGYHLCYKCALTAGAEPTALFAVALSVAVPINLASLGRGGTGRMLAVLRRRPLVLAGAGIVCTASFLAFLGALAQGGAGAVLTLRNTSVVFALLLALTLGERPGLRRWLGAALVAAGAGLLGWPTRG